MKNIIWLLVPLLLLSISVIAIAEDNETAQNQTAVLISENTTTTPEVIDEGDLNETITSTDVTMQQFRVWFAFNQEKKAQHELELARLRLIQAKIAAKHNDTTAMDKAIEAHNQIMEKVKARINGISNKGGNVTGLDRAVQVHERRIEILNKILAKANLTEEQRAKIEAKIAHVQNVTEKLKALEEVKNESRKETESGEQLGETERNRTRAQNESCLDNETKEGSCIACEGCGSGLQGNQSGKQKASD